MQFESTPWRGQTIAAASNFGDGTLGAVLLAIRPRYLAWGDRRACCSSPGAAHTPEESKASREHCRTCRTSPGSLQFIFTFMFITKWSGRCMLLESKTNAGIERT
jgi:hypothetical protein